MSFLPSRGQARVNADVLNDAPHLRRFATNLDHAQDPLRGTAMGKRASTFFESLDIQCCSTGLSRDSVPSAPPPMLYIPRFTV
ncbi:hypothetical protein FA13DRAFT_1732279 [Coprinellus micaceus]|uniref:Uncharacterized protein n=1 Tax=Coprinellus micaceus TaxID=71717 RepID=A0A4Y7TCU5_COPMI|nr:hypothetical protein FA13DRAFT_1732279 [Coprinellus micaceus]